MEQVERTVFDQVIDRKGTNSLKYDFAVERGKPEDILPLWVADMDFRVPQCVTDKLQEVIAHGIYGYTDSKESYFLALANWMEQRHNWKVAPEWLVKTPGVVFAITQAVRAFTQEGDSVLIQQPVYYPFKKVVVINNRKVVSNDLVYEDGKYHIDFIDFENKIVENNVKLFILCSPHNPVGRVWTKEELIQLGDICHKHGVLVVSDEIHQDFVYEGHTHHVFTSLKDSFAQIAIVATAPSKTFNLAGLQASNIFIPNPKLRERFKQEVERSGYDELNTVGIAACEAAYREGAPWLDALKDYLVENIAFTRQFLAQRIPQIKLVEPEGTYLLWLDCKELGLSAEELEELIAQKAKVWLNNGQIFGEVGACFQRINITCPRSVLAQALEQLAVAIDAHKKK